MNQIITGAAGGIVGDLTGEALYGKPHLEESGNQECLHRDIHKIVACLEHITSVSPRAPRYKRITLQPGTLVPMHNEHYDRHYNVAQVSAITPVIFEVIGLGQAYSLTLNPGWNVLNMPEQTNWGLPSNASANVSVLYCASDVLFGNAV
jgi:hypothetical protein